MYYYTTREIHVRLNVYTKHCPFIIFLCCLCPALHELHQMTSLSHGFWLSFTNQMDGPETGRWEEPVWDLYSSSLSVTVFLDWRSQILQVVFSYSRVSQSIAFIQTNCGLVKSVSSCSVVPEEDLSFQMVCCCLQVNHSLRTNDPHCSPGCGSSSFPPCT